MARFRRFSISLRNLHVRDFIPKTWQRQKRKIKIFLLVPHPLDFSNGKVRPSCYFGKSRTRTSVYEWRPHNKNSKTFLPWLQAPIKILSGKTEQSDDPIFVSRMRNAEACTLLKNHHELASEKIKKKKASEKGQKWGFLGVFFLVFIIKDNSDSKIRF